MTQTLSKQLWNSDGSRRLPKTRDLDRAMCAMKAEALDRLFEFDARGPLYFLPTKEWVGALAKTLRDLKVKRVLEVGAGDGFLASLLQQAAPELHVTATDSGAWETPRARMNAAERRILRGIEVPGLLLGRNVLPIEATAAIRRFKPDLVIACWMPPGPLLDRLVRSRVRYVLEIGAAGGVTSGQWSWRFNHDFLDGPVESLARCRMDRKPPRNLQSRVTLYYGAAHEEHHVERPKRGDWLWQFRPK